MKKKIASIFVVVATMCIVLLAFTQPPADAPQAFRQYCAGQCHLTPTSVLSGKKTAFESWGKLSSVDRSLEVCNMGVRLLSKQKNGLPEEAHEEIVSYLDSYFGRKNRLARNGEANAEPLLTATTNE